MSGTRQLFKDIFFLLGDARQRLPKVVAAQILAAALDLVSLGLAAPFVVVLFQPGALGAAEAGKLGSLGALFAQVDKVTIAWLGLAVVIAFALKSVTSYRLQRAIVEFCEGHRGHLMERLMVARMRQPYEELLNKNSSETINDLLNSTQQYSVGVLMPMLRLTAEILSITAMVAYLAFVSMEILAFAAAILLAVMVLYGRAVRTRLSIIGTEYNKSSAALIKAAHQGLGGITELRVLGKEHTVIEDVRAEAGRLTNAMAAYLGLQSIPRPLIEFAVVLLLVILGLSALRTGADGTLGAFIGIFAVASLRLLPGATSVISTLANIRHSSYSVGKLAKDLGQSEIQIVSATSVPSPPPRPTPFRSVAFDRVAYQYPGARDAAVIEASFQIVAGQAVGLIGRTGSGKSTLAALLLGLLNPKTGRVIVNGCASSLDSAEWRAHMAYVPQSVFLLDDTIRNNIALGERPHEIDNARIERAVSAAQLQELLALDPQGLGATVGERGARLSGGQRQRIALARALYFNRDFIVMDEATASLDQETERAVVAAIRALHGSRTLFIIAHRTSTLEGCDLILRMDGGRIVESGSYNQLIRATSG